MSTTKVRLLGSKSSADNISYAIFVGAILLANAALTFGFGMRYGAQIINTGHAGLSAFLGGFMLMLFFDLAALGWFVARRREELSTDQIAIAKKLATMSMIASTLVSAIQLAMSTTLINLSAIHDLIGTLALLMMVVVAAAHFVGIFYYTSRSKANQLAELESEQKARVSNMRLQQRALVQDTVIEKVNQKVYAEVDKIAEVEKDKILREFYADFNYIEQQTGHPSPTPAPDPEAKLINTRELAEIVAEAVNKKLAGTSPQPPLEKTKTAQVPGELPAAAPSLPPTQATPLTIDLNPGPDATIFPKATPDNPTGLNGHQQLGNGTD